MRTLKFLLSAAVFAQAFTLWGISFSTASDDIRTVVLNGMDAPGFEPGYRFTSLLFQSRPTIDREGRVAFTAEVRGSGFNQWSWGLWHEDVSGDLELIVRRNQQAPQLESGVIISNFSSAILNSNGQLAFEARLAGPGVADDLNSRTLWHQDELGELQLLAREGDPASGTNEVFDAFADTVFGDGGHSVFFAWLGESRWSRTGSGYWAASPDGEVRRVVLTGETAPGLGSGVTFAGFDYFPDIETRSTIAVNMHGQIAFSGSLFGEEITGANYYSIWRSEPNNEISLVTRSTMPAAATEEGTTFSFLEPPTIADDGRISFVAGLQGSAVNSTNNTGIWTTSDEGLELVVRAGIPAPGLNDVFLQSVFYPNNVPQTTSDGHFAFLGILGGPGVDTSNDSSIWLRHPDGTLQIVAREGDPVPGTEGAVFGSVAGNILEGSFSLNANGQVAFVASAISPTGTRSGIWATDLTGELQPIVMVGETFDVSDDPLSPNLQTVSSFGFARGYSGTVGRPNAFNDLGQIAFSALFEASSNNVGGVFVSNRVAMVEELPGDYDRNGVVDSLDYQVWRSTFGTTNLIADGNGNGLVDAADYTVWRDNLGATSGAFAMGPQTHAVPEANSLSLVIGAVLAWALGSSKREAR